MKKKIFLIALAACLITLSVAGSSLAYFTDTDAKTNVFTSGNVDIVLNMKGYNSDNEETQTKMYPGMNYNNYATIENIGSEDAYVGAIIDVILPTNEETGVATLTTTEIVDLFVGLNSYTTQCVATTNGYRIYVVMGSLIGTANTTDNGTATANVFTGVSIPKEWDHAQMANFKDMTVNVKGYAVQTVGLADAEAALTAAFAVWADGYNTTTQAEQVDPDA